MPLIANQAPNKKKACSPTCYAVSRSSGCRASMPPSSDLMGGVMAGCLGKE